MSPPARFFSLTRLLPVLLVTCPGTSPAQNHLSAPVLTLRPAVEISMPTEPGRVYQMQASADLSSWQNRGTPIFGTGTPILQPMAGGSSQFFRLQVLTTPVMGDAPWSPEGSVLQLNDGTRLVRYDFQADGRGTSHTGNAATAFTWTWLRDGLSRARAELTLPGSPTSGVPVKEVIQFTYVAAKTGQFTRRGYTGTRLDNTDSGSFGPAPAATSPLVLSLMTGRTIAFSESPAGNGLTFTTPNAGLRLIDGTTSGFSGTWLVTGNTTARLTASFGTTHGEEYRFTFTSPLTGRYSRQTFTEGVFRDEDQGTFCLGTAP